MGRWGFIPNLFKRSKVCSDGEDDCLAFWQASKCLILHSKLGLDKIILGFNHSLGAKSSSCEDPIPTLAGSSFSVGFGTSRS